MTWICGARQATRTSPSAAQKHRATFGSFGHVRERDEQVRCQHRQKRKIKRSSSATAPRCSAMKDCKNSNLAGTRYLAKTRRIDTARRPRSASQNITGHFHDGAAEHLQESKFFSSSNQSTTSSAFHLPGETSARPTGNEERNMASPSVATAHSCRGFREKPDVVPGGVKTRAFSVQRACLSMRIPAS